MLKDYDWHMAGSRRQGDHLRGMTEAPPAGSRVILADWKAYVDLPLARVTTTQMEFGTQQKSASVFGVVNYSCNADGQVKRTRVLLVTEVLDHTAEATNIMLDEVLRRLPLQGYEKDTSFQTPADISLVEKAQRTF